jgi:hypothetical protein
MRICLVGLIAIYAIYNGYIRGELPNAAGIPFTEDRRVGDRHDDSVAALASGNVAAADPVTGVASAASDEVSTAIAALLLSYEEMPNENCEIYCGPIPAGVMYFAPFRRLFLGCVAPRGDGSPRCRLS